ncbi:4-hydroxy-tetrahydrodipicolinate synthase [Buchnera aphidicola]|uniref:4-hydroxy-tetrahydrodipicolinate synthase n=1 Tax=Buchnera aphidicola subsp. Acyrthosiphon pisum (strain 5A) TaxID=563178 RepID=DAPA_BUCA5|nr:4-hydroxy-tetrahydrodipicolinate synthase [Buchnera aphidicola]B8D8P8.1 RecName: Full=4-hydroxy-tetrahydrodipicolinate synthase; Short=HTPA synthase [Buchnera aphidicola str. 5A (Acyrthosiphon pisum)]ACL30470.1 dihydrodipicolinate synthase [Buchnera aphidicola str. 5A (Acyrthosiphon pisum)]OQX98938.1 MAG: 4-hydroxy-tetrahydrodipicolinate synthase [Erwiniaceae bacterium 4572_131]
MFKGSIVALITPMDEKGQICRISLEKLINYHIASKTEAIVSIGTTGESATLSQEEHINIVMLTLELADGRIPVIAGTGANATTEAISLTKRFEKSGVAGCLSVTPYYNRPTQEGLYQHFKAISENTELPQILYNVPSRTGCDLLPETVAKLSHFNNIIGIKEATGDLSRIHKIKELVKTNFLLISGDDATALDFMQLGGQGVISVTANIAAKEMMEICSYALKGDFINARSINKRLMLLHEALFIEPNPIPVKWLAKKIGLIKSDTLRLPMTPVLDSTRFQLEKAIQYANLKIS